MREWMRQREEYLQGGRSRLQGLCRCHRPPRRRHTGQGAACRSWDRSAQWQQHTTWAHWGRLLRGNEDKVMLSLMVRIMA